MMHCTCETVNTTGQTHRGDGCGLSDVKATSVAAELEQGKKEDVTNLVHLPGIQRGCRPEKPEIRLRVFDSIPGRSKARTVHLEDLMRRPDDRHDMFGAPMVTRRSVSLGSLPDCLRVPFQTPRDFANPGRSVKRQGEPAFVPLWNPACEAGLATCRAWGCALVHDRG